MADLERTYNVPLRKEAQKVPKYKRTQKSIIALRQFLARHMKSEDIRLSGFLNVFLHRHGRKNPPHHIEVKARKDKDNVVFVELAQGDIFFKKEEPKKKEKEHKIEVAKEEKQKEEKILKQEEEKKEILEKEMPKAKGRKTKAQEKFESNEDKQKTREEMVITKKNKDDPTFH